MTQEAVSPEVRQHRRAGHDVAPWILNRWSPRSMTGEPLADAELMPLFEAARWAPSCFNAQLWKFIYAKRDTPHWPAFLGLLVEANRVWAERAAALVVVTARKNFEKNEKPSRTSQFDAGAAWENLALEGARRDLVVHGMAGFDYDRARSELRIPAAYDVLAMIAIGKRGPRDALPEKARAGEQPSDRRPLKEIVQEGAYPAA